MTSRALSYTLSRPRVLIPALIGVALLIDGNWRVAGFVLLGVAFIKASKLLGADELDRELVQREARREHGVLRPLQPSERAELDALERYAKELRRSGADPQLVKETLEEAWRIIARAGGRDATGDLRTFRLSLPLLPEVQAAGGESLAERIRRELELLRATHKEVGAP